MSAYEDSGWYEAAGKLEPELHTGHGASAELIVTRGEEARKRLQELAAHDLLFNEFHFELFDPCYSHQDSIVKFAIRHHELMEKHKEATFPRRSQNQTVSSGVEGAHEGTTADKSGAARCHVCGCDVWKSGACASCGEPEKLNNAQQVFNCSETEAFHRAFGVPCSKCEPVALAESSLSSPPPKCRHCPSRLGEHHVHNCAFWGQVLPSECLLETTVRQSPSLSAPGAESAHSGKQNAADKSELLPTQLPKAE